MLFLYWEASVGRCHQLADMGGATNGAQGYPKSAPTKLEAYIIESDEISDGKLIGHQSLSKCWILGSVCGLVGCGSEFPAKADGGPDGLTLVW